MNPLSVKGIAGFQARLYSRRAQMKALAATLGLNTLVPSSMDVRLTSTSQLIGAKNLQLTISIDPYTRLTARGYVVLHVPDYYKGANNDYMIASTKPTPCTTSHGTVLSCTFSRRQQ